MNEREILIANTKTQKRSKLTTAATTLGELKTALDAAGIDYSGMTFTEGISKTQLLDDATQLPQNVMYKGEPTNNLVILLTNTKKNIASGAMSRQEAYAIIKAHDLQDAVKSYFGRNFTQVPTANLEEFISKEMSVAVVNEKSAPVESKPAEPSVIKLEERIADSVIISLDALANLDVLSIRDLLYISDRLNDYVAKYMNNEKHLSMVEEETTVENPDNSVSTSDGSINDDDIDGMIADLNV